MTKRQRDVLSLARKFCAEAEVACTKGNHLVIILKNAAGETRKVFTGASPSDHRANVRLKADIRREASVIGLAV